MSEKISTVDAVKALTRKAVVELSDGRSVETRLCKVKDIPVFVQFIGMLFGELGVVGVPLSDQKAVEGLVAAKMNDPAFILKLISEKANELFVIIARFTSLSVEDIAELDVDDAVTVCQRVVEINYDFFTQKVLPAIQATLAAKMAAK